MALMLFARTVGVRVAQLGVAACFVGIFIAAPVAAAQREPIFKIPGLTVRGDSTSITIILLLTVLAFLPAILLSMTPFVRILIIFHFLRQALGTQTAPTNQTLIGLSLFLTYFIMQPVGVAIHEQAIIPFERGRIT